MDRMRCMRSFLFEKTLSSQLVSEATENPQNFHQALLLLASLARLAPDSVLRNVMPIFTFMGTNVFHRDDTYSFRVVQQVGSPVPCETNPVLT